MAVPKRKTTQSKLNMRRAHSRLSTENRVEDSHTGEPQRRHHIYLNKGMSKEHQRHEE